MKVEQVEIESWPDPAPHGNYPADWHGRILIVHLDERTALHFPDPIRATVTTASHTIRVVVHIDEDSTRPVVDELHVTRRPNGQPINADTLRTLGLHGALGEIVKRTGIRWVSEDGKRWRIDRTMGNEWTGRVTPDQAALALKPVGKRAVPMDELERAAAAYRQAIAEGRKDPTIAVSEALGVSRSTAARRLDKARRAGLLGPALPQRAGEGRKP